MLQSSLNRETTINITHFQKLLGLIMSVAQDKTMCETPSVAVVIINAGSLFAEGLDLEIAAILVSKN